MTDDMTAGVIILGTDSGTFWTGKAAEPWTDEPAAAMAFHSPRAAWQTAERLEQTETDYLEDSAVELHLRAEHDPQQTTLVTTTAHRSNRPGLRRRWRQHLKEPLPPDLPSPSGNDSVLIARIAEYLQDLDAIPSPTGDGAGQLEAIDRGVLAVLGAAANQNPQRLRALVREHLDHQHGSALLAMLGLSPEPDAQRPAPQSRQQVRDDRAEYQSEHSQTSAPAEEPVAPTGAGEGARHAVAEVLPMFVRRHFVQVDGRFYHRRQPDRLAFERNGAGFRARDDSEGVAMALVEIAAARGWGAIKVRGSNSFRRRVWLAASRRGLEVMGYAPTNTERALSEESANRSKQRSNDTRRRTIPTESRIEGNARSPVVGRLLDHGRAPYLYNEARSPSYFVSIEGEHGRIATYWGLDLERALKESGVAVGDRVRLTRDPASAGVDNFKLVDGDQADRRAGRATWSVSLVGEGRAVPRTPDQQPFDRSVPGDAASRAVDRFASMRLAALTSADRARLQHLVAAARDRLSTGNAEMLPTWPPKTADLRWAEPAR